MQADNRSVIRKVNQRAMLDYIIQTGGTSRAEIAKALGLSKPAVSENVLGMLESGIISEHGIVESNVGKKGTMLKFNSDRLYILVLDIKAELFENSLVISVCDLSYREKFKTVITIRAVDLLDKMEGMIRESLSQHQIDMKSIKVIVVSVSSVVKDGIQKNLFKGNETPNGIREIIATFFNQDILVYNDINLAAIGEREFGGGIVKENMAYLWMDMGIGSGILLNGELYEGSLGAAGEISFLKTAVIKNNQLVYRCLCDVASIEAVEAKLNQEYEKSEYLSLVKKQNNELSFADLVAGRDQGDEYCFNICSFLYRCVAEAVYVLALTLDLDSVVIDGQINLLGEELYQYIKQYIKDVPYMKTKVSKPNRKDATLWGGYYVGVQWVVDTLL